MDYKILLGYLSVLLVLVSYSIYFRQILLRQVVPHPFSWMIWGLVELIGFTAIWVKHGGSGSWAFGFTALACFAVAALGFFYSVRPALTKIDWILLSLAILSILLWVLTKDPTLSVVLLAITDGLGMAFTLKKTYLDPNRESAALFGISCFRSLIALLALQSYSVATWLYPSSLAFTNALVVLMILVRRNKLNLKTSV